MAEESIQILKELSPVTRTTFAREMSENTGEPVMYYSSIPPENIDVATANILDEDNYGDISELFETEVPRPEMEDEDAIDA